MIEIKSAIQWKAMSKRISFNFEDEDNDENEPPHEQNKAIEVPEPPVIITSTFLLDLFPFLDIKSMFFAAPMKEKRPPRRRNLPTTFSMKSFVFEDVEGFQPTTVPQLRLLCWKIKPWKQPKSNKLFSSQFGVQWNVDCDEVFPGW